MPYSVELSRTNPTCFLFLIDQSSSMSEPFGGQPDKPKAEGVADTINPLLKALPPTGSTAAGIRDAFAVGVLSHGGRVSFARGCRWAKQQLGPSSLVAARPLRPAEPRRKVAGGRGGLPEQKFRFGFW